MNNKKPSNLEAFRDRNHPVGKTAAIRVKKETLKALDALRLTKSETYGQIVDRLILRRDFDIIHGKMIINKNINSVEYTNDIVPMNWKGESVWSASSNTNGPFTKCPVSVNNS